MARPMKKAWDAKPEVSVVGHGIHKRPKHGLPIAIPQAALMMIGASGWFENYKS